MSVLKKFLDTVSLAGYEVAEINNFMFCSHYITSGFALSKFYGPRRRDVSGGYLFTREDGKIFYDFFIGGSNYGTHLNSNVNNYDLGFSMVFPCSLALKFLSIES